MEIINVKAYTMEDKITIAKNFLMKEVVEPKNVDNIHESFSSEDPFKSMVVGVSLSRTLHLMPCRNNETGYGAIKRLERRGYICASIADLARYMSKNVNVEDAKKFAGVLAVSKDSLLEIPENKCIYAPYVHAGNDRKERRSFSFFNLASRFSVKYAIIVFDKTESGLSAQGGV